MRLLKVSMLLMCCVLAWCADAGDRADLERRSRELLLAKGVQELRLNVSVAHDTSALADQQAMALNESLMRQEAEKPGSVSVAQVRSVTMVTVLGPTLGRLAVAVANYQSTALALDVLRRNGLEVDKEVASVHAAAWLQVSKCADDLSACESYVAALAEKAGDFKGRIADLVAAVSESRKGLMKSLEQERQRRAGL